MTVFEPFPVPSNTGLALFLVKNRVSKWSIWGVLTKEKTSWPISTYFHPRIPKKSQFPRQNSLCSSISGIPHFLPSKSMWAVGLENYRVPNPRDFRKKKCFFMIFLKLFCSDLNDLKFKLCTEDPVKENR